MAKTKVLHVIKGLGRGGAEQLLVSAAPYGDASRFEYEVAYVLPHKDALVSALRDAGITVHCLGEGGGKTWPLRLRRLVKERGIDIVHTHSPQTAALARLALGRRSRFIHTEHNVWECYRPTTYWANMLTLARNQMVFAVSDDVGRSIRYPAWLRWLPMPQVRTLYHGLDPKQTAAWKGFEGVREEFGIAPDAPLIGTVGNFRPEKGQKYLIEAMSEVAARVPGVRLMMVGIGGLEQQMRAQVRQAGLDDVVVFAGFREDAVRLMSAFDVFALSSLQEGLPIAFLEAMTLGRPVVVTDAGGMPEVVRDGVEGLVVPKGDGAALAAGLVRMLGDADARRRMGEASRERAAEFDIRETVKRMEAVYADLMTAR